MQVAGIYKEYLNASNWYNRATPSFQALEFAEKVRATDSILEIGTGSGIDAQTISEKCKQIISIDIKPGECHLVASADHLPFKNSYFDGLFCRGVLHLCSDPQLAFEESIRPVRQGGLIFVSYLVDIRDATSSMGLANIIPNGLDIRDSSYKEINHDDHKHIIAQLWGQRI